MSTIARFVRVRAVSVGAVALAGGLALTACTQSPPARPTSTTTAPQHGPDKAIAVIRAAYLADTSPTEAAFTTFSTRFQALGGQGSRAQITTLVTPMLKVLASSVKKVYALRLETNAKIGRAIDSAVATDNTVYSGLEDLVSGYGSRTFDLNSWGEAFSSAIKQANTAANVLRKDLGLKPIASSSS